MIFYCLKYFVLVLICIVSQVDNSRQNIQASTSKKHILAAATGTGINPWFCPADLDCEKLDPDCLICTYERNCVYGNKTVGNCSVPHQFSCKVRKQNLIYTLHRLPVIFQILKTKFANTVIL